MANTFLRNMNTPGHAHPGESAENKLQSLTQALGAAKIGYWTWAPDGRMHWDSVTKALTGAPDVNQNTSITDLLVHIDGGHEQLLDAFEASSLKQIPFIQTVTIIQGKRKLRKLRMIGQVDTSTEHKEQSIAGICFEDSAAGSAVENRTSTLEDFFDHSKVMMAELDLEGVFLRANTAWGSFLGTDSSHLIGRSLLNYLHPNNLPNTKVWLKQLTKRQNIADIRPTAQGELSAQVYIHGKGNREISWTWTADLKTKRIFTITRDITETYQEEAELTKELELAQQSNTELESFASTASHDLREPLRMISSYLELLQERYLEALDNRGRRYIDYACEGANRMRTLIDDLLAYSRIGKTSNPHEAVALEDVIANAIDNLSVAIRQSKAEITVDINDAPIAWVIRSGSHGFSRIYSATRLNSNSPMPFQSSQSALPTALTYKGTGNIS